MMAEKASANQDRKTVNHNKGDGPFHPHPKSVLIPIHITFSYKHKTENQPYN